MPTEQLINELQSFGVRLVDPKAGRRQPSRRRRSVRPYADDDRRRDRDDPGAQRAGVREPLPRRQAGRPRPQPGQPRRRRDRRGQVPVAAALLRALDRRRHSLFQDRDAARPRRAGDHDPADLHPLSEPDQDLPVLRHRPVARRRPHHRTQDPRAARRSRESRRRTRWRHAHGDDHGHAARQRSRRRDPVRERDRRQGRGRSADPGPVRAAG